MKPMQIILKNEYIINSFGRKELKLNNQQLIDDKVKEGYLIKNIITESNVFNKDSYKSGSARNIYFVEIYLLELSHNL